MKRLCIIPARGGSKRLPNKNVTMLNDKPLVCHTIDAAAISGIFDDIIFSSDSDIILEVVSEYLDIRTKTMNEPNIILNKRPEWLATDTSKVIDTVEYYFENYNNNYHDYEQVWLLLPTCPLRTFNDMRNANLLMNEDVDGVISITEMEFPPTLGLNKTNDDIISAYDKSDPWVNGNSRSQDHPTVYRPNGALYAAWWDSFDKNRNFYKGKVKGYFMPRSKSIDIDTRFDFELAKHMIEEMV